ncbi:hypothetical protein [Microscilla marina]|uniref:hypothetical protein n=1 Tax=Microscilla marina TaxID=1027 RepID=UPI0012FACFEC|nr:hypothetical protein [Microscilla marina]
MKYIVSFTFVILWSCSTLYAQEQAPLFKYHPAKKKKVATTASGKKAIAKKKVKLTLTERYRQKMSHLKNSKATPKSKARIRRKND